ncbi:MAG: hypothetical protein ACOYWZ_11890 [Bacillota bacterium]
MFLVLAISFEVLVANLMKFSNEFTELISSVIIWLFNL